MEALTKVVEIGLTIHHMAETAKSNQQSCKLLGSTVQGLTTIAKEMVEFYIDEGVSSSAFTFLGNLQRELESAEELVAKAGSMPLLQRFLCADKYQDDFRDAMTNLNLLLSALNTTNSFLAAKNETVTFKSKVASIEESLTDLKAKSEQETFPKEVSCEEQAIWIQLSKTTDRLMNGVISKNEARQEFMHHMEELYDANHSEGNLSGLFKFLNEEIEKGKVEKDKRAQLFNELLLEVAIRMTLDPPDWAFCPLTGTIMKEPVTVKECTIQTPFERSFAEEWFFERGHRRCPIIGQVLDTVTLVPNEEIKARIEAWKREANWQKLDVEDGEKTRDEMSGEGSANRSSSAADEAPAMKSGSTEQADPVPSWLFPRTRRLIARIGGKSHPADAPSPVSHPTPTPTPTPNPNPNPNPAETTGAPAWLFPRTRRFIAWVGEEPHPADAPSAVSHRNSNSVEVAGQNRAAAGSRPASTDWQ